MKFDLPELLEFLKLYPSMRLVNMTERQAVVSGVYSLNAHMDGFKTVSKNYSLRITIPRDYPRSIPTVYETDAKIPRILEYHTYKDGSFCLGSEIKLKSILYEYPTLRDFAEKILNPFLYAVTYKILYGIYPFGELDHGEAGLVDDYQELFGVEGKASVLRVLVALGKRKRLANKLRCPCDCGSRISECDFRFRLVNWRQLAKRRWFRKHLGSFSPVAKPKKLPNKRKGNGRNGKKVS